MDRIPLYIVAGFLGNGKTTFINTLLPNRPERTAVIQMEKGRTAAACETVLHLRAPAADETKGTAYRIEQFVKETRPREVWLEWNGMVPLETAEKIFSRRNMERLFDLKEIFFAATPRFCLTQLGATGDAVYGQLLQADRFIMCSTDSGAEYEKALHLIRAVRPDIPVTTLEESARKRIGKILVKKPLQISASFLTVAFFLVAGILGFILTDADPSFSDLRTAFSFWTATLLQALPFLVIGVVISSILQLFLSPAFVERFLRKNHFTGTVTALSAAFFFPLCDCGAVPVFRSLVARKVPVSTALTFMLAGPLINPVVLISTYVAFGGNMEIFLWRTVGGIVTVLFIGLTFFAYTGLDGMTTGRIPLSFCSGDSIRPEMNRFMQAVVHSRREFMRIIPYVLAGTLLSSFFQVYGSSLMQNLGIWPTNIVMIPLMMVIAFFLSVCSTADAMIARNFAAHVPPAGILSFLLFGPMLDLKNFLLLRALFPKAFVWRLLGTTFCMCAFTAAMYVLAAGGGWL